MFHFFAERVPSEGFAQPEGVDASGGILKICASAMSGVNRRALVAALWVRLRPHAGSAELRAVTRRRGDTERLELAPGGERASAQELLLLQAAKTDVGVLSFFRDAGESGGVCGLSAHQHAVRAKQQRKGPKRRAGAGKHAAPICILICI
jgi:hypothetical protein